MKPITIILIVTFLLGCNSTKREKVQGEDASFYNYQYEKIKKECLSMQSEYFFTHFPISVNTPLSFSSVTDDVARCYSYVLAIYNCNIDTLIEKKNDLKKESLKSYLSTDSTMLILKNNTFFYEIKKRLIEGEVLIPFFDDEILSTGDDFNFPDLLSSETSSGLSPNFEIFIIKSGSVYNSSDNDKNLLQYLPRTHNEVYTQGICLNLKSRYAIYWTIFY